MKIRSLLAILAVVLGVLGAGLSYAGYNESLRLSTLTSTQSYTSTSTRTITSARTETSVMTTNSTFSILDQVLEIRGNDGYGARYDDVSLTLDAGKVNVSYRSEGGRVDFWMLDEGGFKLFESRLLRTLFFEPDVPYIVRELRSSSYEFTEDIRTSATYYFVFVNQNDGPVSVTLHVDGGMQTEVLTSTKEQVDYFTQATPFVTETVSFTTHAVGLGLPFYSGIGLFIVAGVVLAVSRMKGRLGGVRSQKHMFEENVCRRCGVENPTGNLFCRQCGNPLRDETRVY